MYRRAALAQLLACGKGVLVLDEPFASLDTDSADEVREDHTRAVLNEWC